MLYAGRRVRIRQPSLDPPASVALMAMALGLALVLLGSDPMGWVHVQPAFVLVDRINFNETLLQGC